VHHTLKRIKMYYVDDENIPSNFSWRTFIGGILFTASIGFYVSFRLLQALFSWTTLIVCF